MKKLLILLFVLSACKKDNTSEPEILNVEKFTKVENSNVLLSLKPNTACDYVELRMSSGQGPLGNEMYLIRAYTGNKMELGVTCLDALEHLPLTETGFAEDCTPLCYYHYVVAVKNGNISIYNSLAGLKEFLGDINSEADAAITAIANGYEFDYNDKAVAGVRKVWGGYEILCKKRVKSCSPVQYNQFWLKISAKGIITIKKEILYSTMDACI
jgi:hypothetical protein